MLQYILVTKTPRLWSDETYLKVIYKFQFGKALNTNNPITFNEKLQWLKLNNRKPVFTTMVDKYRVKDYIKNIIGEEYVVPVYGAWDNAEEIDWDSLPNQFVLKCNHDSSSVTIVKNKVDCDKNAIIEKLNRSLRTTYYYGAREWPYKNVKPTIFAEKLLDDNSGEELRDYKFWCFNGKPTYMYITNKGSFVRENFYDMDFKPVDINHGFYRTVPEYNKPDKFEDMKVLAAKLSKDIPFLRVDFFCINGHIYFSEFTFYDWGGMRKFVPEDLDYQLGELIKLPNIKNN